ncbi:sensor domain-containing diguanylate cyclase [Treponema zioleckii]|uniref:sensor domain-containing diguanylate cyclase n=1 Tax=Treponema zioleckii TaxID=331680 RepID=UPI00168B1820|nr:diguanylate cyclase [Treponema zioleckii]
MNIRFSTIEETAYTLEEFIKKEFDANLAKTDVQYANSFMNKLSEFIKYSNSMHKYAKTIYFVLDPEKYPEANSVYFMQAGVSPDSKYVHKTWLLNINFDIKQYKKDDVGHAAWFYEAKSAGKPKWSAPHQNHNIEHAVDTISYTIPIFIDHMFVGVVGLDMSMAELRLVIDNIGLDASFGFLISDDGKTLFYHKDIPGGRLVKSQFNLFTNLTDLTPYFSDEYIGTGKNYKYDWKGVHQRLILDRLSSGMILAISVPEMELLKLQTQMTTRMVYLLVLILISALVLSNILISKIVEPLLTLTEEASRIARGELNTTITFHSNNEIGKLSNSIQKIAIELKEYIDYINAQAYSDRMTGCKNKSAYIDKVKMLEQRMREKLSDFTVYVFDVNGLKKMNDTLGHEYGDMLIKDAAGIIRSVFPEDCIYRTGGDEFVVIDEKVSDATIAKQFATFDKNLEKFNKENENYTVELAISKGATSSDSNTENSYKEIFARADKAMYANKEEYYKKHEDCRRQ